MPTALVVGPVVIQIVLLCAPMCLRIIQARPQWEMLNLIQVLLNLIRGLLNLIQHLEKLCVHTF